MAARTNISEVIGRIRRRVDDMRRKVRSVNGFVIKVGVDPDATYPNGKKVSEVAGLIEYGTHKMAPRPFVRMACREHYNQWQQMVKSAVVAELKKKSSPAIETVLHEAAKKIAADISRSVVTVGAVDTGKLRDSIKAEVTRQ